MQTSKKIVENKQITAHVFERLTAVPKGKNQSKVIFEDLFVECEKGRTALYSGFAIGQVDLKDGRNVAVRGSSDKFIAVSCLIGAK